MLYKCHKINPNHGGSYVDSPDWTENKNSKKKIIKKGNKWFQCALTDPLNQQGIKKDPQRTVKIETVKNKYNFEVMNFQSEKKR